MNQLRTWFQSWIAGFSPVLTAAVVATAIGLGFAASSALGSIGPGWERVWLVPAALVGFLATRPVRRAVLWVAGLKPPWSYRVVAAVSAVAAITLVIAIERGWLNLERILLGLAGLAATAGFVLLTTSRRRYRLLALPAFAVGFAGAGLLWRVLDSDLLLSAPWYLGFVPVVLVAIALADLSGRLLQGWVFARLPWEFVLSLGIGAAAAIYLVAVPALKEEEERLERKPVLPVANGPIAYVRELAGRAVIEITGESGGVLIRSAKPGSAVSWSPDGTKLAFVRGRGATSHVCIFETEKRTPTCITPEPADYYDPAWSPDGSRLAFTVQDASGNGDLYVTPASAILREELRPLLRSPASEIDPTWSPDGDEIAFASNATGQFDIYAIAADGTRAARLSRGPEFGANDRSPVWAPHGRTIAFVSASEPPEKTDIFLVDADGRGGLTNLTKSATESSADPVWSPDGTAIAFSRSEQIHRIYLQGVKRLDPGEAKRAKGARGPASNPAWRPLPDPDMPPMWFPRLVRKYAPLVRLHSGEKYSPMGASEFIAMSRLDWVGCKNGRITTGPPAEDRLGGEPPGDDGDYKFKDCARELRTFSVLEATRPKDRDDVGFVLTPSQRAPVGPRPSARRPGSETADDVRTFVAGSVPTYFEHIPRRSITYWMFYGFSATSPAGRQGEHQGDWERITVCLDRSSHAIGVVYHRHNFNRARRWSLVPKFGSHPIVYSANGSHASYSSPGTNPVLETFDRRDEGPVWATWENLRDILRQKWYGYGGSWGRPPAPEGPSRYKVGDEGC